MFFGGLEVTSFLSGFGVQGLGIEIPSPELRNSMLQTGMKEAQEPVGSSFWI